MKDIIIKAKQIKKELIIIFTCLAAAIGLNIYSIIRFKTDWNELWNQLYMVIFVAFLLYILLGILRLLIWGIILPFRKR